MKAKYLGFTNGKSYIRAFDSKGVLTLERLLQVRFFSYELRKTSSDILPASNKLWAEHLLALANVPYIDELSRKYGINKRIHVTPPVFNLCVDFYRDLPRMAVIYRFRVKSSKTVQLLYGATFKLYICIATDNRRQVPIYGREFNLLIPTTGLKGRLATSFLDGLMSPQ